MNTAVPDRFFLLSCRDAIAAMRNAGMNNTAIACAITDIRSAAINEEFRRLTQMTLNNPPYHFRWCDMQDALE